MSLNHGLFLQGEFLEPDSNVHIVMCNYSPGAFGPEAYKSYLVRVVWCGETARPDAFSFGAGARFIARSHDLLDAQICEPKRSCDLCGALQNAPQIADIENGPSLCPDCLKHFTAIPNGHVKDCIYRFLSGNVL